MKTNVNVRSLEKEERYKDIAFMTFLAAFISTPVVLIGNLALVAGEEAFPGALFCFGFAAFCVVAMLLAGIFAPTNEDRVLARAERRLLKDYGGDRTALAVERAKDGHRQAASRLADLRTVAARTPGGEAAMSHAVSSATAEEELRAAELRDAKEAHMVVLESVSADLAALRLEFADRRRKTVTAPPSLPPAPNAETPLVRRARVAALAETPDIDDFVGLAEADAALAAEEEFPSAPAARR